MDLERLSALEAKLSNFVFLDNCDNLININTTRLVLDFISDTDIKLQTLLKYYKDAEDYDPEKTCNLLQKAFGTLGITHKLNQKEIQHYVAGQTFNGVVYTKFTFDMVTRLLCFVFGNTSTHIYTGSNLTPLLELKHLNILSIRNNNVLVDITPVSGLETLTRLELVNCPLVTDFAPVSSLTKLRELVIVGNDHIENIKFLEGVELNALYLLQCKTLVDISLNSTTLTNVSIIKCPSVNNLETLVNIPNLKHLELSDCNDKNLDFLKELASLEELTIETNNEDFARPPNVKIINSVEVV